MISINIDRHQLLICCVMQMNGCQRACDAARRWQIETAFQVQLAETNVSDVLQTEIHFIVTWVAHWLTEESPNRKKWDAPWKTWK